MKTTAGPNLVVSLAPYFNVHVTNFVIFSIWRGTFQVICSTSLFLSYISLNFLETKLYDLVILRFMYVIYPSVMSVGYSTSTWLPTTTLDFSLFYNHPFLYFFTRFDVRLYPQIGKYDRINTPSLLWTRNKWLNNKSEQFENSWFRSSSREVVYIKVMSEYFIPVYLKLFNVI